MGIHAQPSSFDPIFDTDTTHKVPITIQTRIERQPVLSIVPGGQWSRMTLAQRVAAIGELFAAGHSSREVASKLESSRSAVVGLAMRSAIRIPPAERIVCAPYQPAPDPVPAKTWRVLPGTTPLGLEHTTGCMWPVDVAGASQQMFCNGTLHQEGYCRTHHRMSKPSARGRRYGDTEIDYLADQFSAFDVPEMSAADVDDAVADLGVKQNMEIE